jgi:hypothetical protein
MSATTHLPPAEQASATRNSEGQNAELQDKDKDDLKEPSFDGHMTYFPVFCLTEVPDAV